MGSGTLLTTCAHSDSQEGPSACALDKNFKPTAPACLDQVTPTATYLKLDRANGPRVLCGRADLGCYEVK